MANKHIGEVPASEFGGGVVLRLDMAGLAALEDEFGEFTWSNRLFGGLSMVSPSKMMAVLKASLRNNKGTLFSTGDSHAGMAARQAVRLLAKKCQDAITMAIYGKPFEQWVADNNAPHEDDEDPQRRRGGIVAEAYKAAIRAGITDDQFWSSSLCALRQRIEITFEQQVEDMWTLAWCAAKLNVLAWHDPKNLPANAASIWEKAPDPAVRACSRVWPAGRLKP
jgi:hypothetical protein